MEQTHLHVIDRITCQRAIYHSLLESFLNSRDEFAAAQRDAGVTRQAVTKHLQALADAGLVRDTWRGRERIWALEPRRLERARQYLDQISGQWDAALARLRTFVEDRR